VQTDGVQPISWIETASGDIRESSTRGISFGYRESLEGPLWPQTRIENDKSVDGRADIAGSDRTFFDKKELPLGFMRTNNKNSKVTDNKYRLTTLPSSIT
jgi:hypothetical protein